MVEEIKENKFKSGIEKNNRIKIKIQKLTTIKKHWSNHVGKKQGFEYYVDKKKQKFNVYVANILWKKKNDNNNNIVDCIKIKHKEIIQEVKD